MHLDKNLNLITTIDSDESLKYIHTSLIGFETFRQYYLPIAKAFSAIYSEGLGTIASPPIAYLMLEDISNSLNFWDDTNKKVGVKNGLINELIRLSNVIEYTKDGWQSVPFDSVKDQFSEEELIEFLGGVCFFTCTCRMHKRNIQPEVMREATAIWGLQTTLLNSTEWMRSLPKLTETDNSGEMAAQ
jgi:hypothetical protein